MFRHGAVARKMPTDRPIDATIARASDLWHPDAMVLSPLARPVALLRLEGAILLTVALLGYDFAGGGWLLFALLILVPDVGMLGYLVTPKLGAVTYNLLHVHAGPAALLAIGLLGGHATFTQIGLIWVAHIGADRMLGFGLKEPTGFKDTHLGRIGPDHDS